jgi:hypothetical protein
VEELIVMAACNTKAKGETVAVIEEVKSTNEGERERKREE